MDQKKLRKEAKERKKSEEQKLIERLLGTNDCGEEGIGVMVIGSSFYVGGKHIFENDIKNK